MLGVVFSEFSEMVEQKFSEDMLDDILDDCSHLASGGSYTSVGTYDYTEIVELVTALSKRTEIPAPALIFTFGEHLFGRFYELYPAFFENIGGAYDFLLTIEDHIHVEVKKLYPDAELPRFECTQENPDEMSMIYSSNRPFADLAEGLITGCINHYSESITVARTDDASTSPPSTKFVLKRAA